MIMLRYCKFRQNLTVKLAIVGYDRQQKKAGGLLPAQTDFFYVHIDMTFIG